ncbi:hypothetical protein P3875_08255 [Myroides sp. JBRI-B21084]|uniref:YncE family protein n=1 Tax=Myroides sp. JBRI-B21084 TaxID=3119977 RepID=UPI0026E422A2|nr:DUF5074 domain-containing protein [Paenimyroides cloacae]WKW45776.1 hypothetical protein P3875_08255 [Paenimyroides cloacae]
MKKILFSVLAGAFFFSCSNTNDDLPVNTDEKYLDGIFVSNEGNFTKGNATSSFINGNLSTITNDIFKLSNGRSLGDVSQHMVVTDKYVFIIMNNSNTIEVVNKKTFKLVYTITQNVSSPRFATVKNNKLYVTSLFNAEVNVYNTDTFAFIKTINLNHTAEQIVATDNYIYAANGFYSGGTTLEVINPETDTNTTDVNINQAINNIATNGQNVFVLSANDTTSSISIVSNNSVLTTKVLNQPIARNLVSYTNYLYYTAGTGVYKINNDLTTESSKLFNVADGDEYSIFYGFNVINGSIFTADAKGFADNSKIVIYKENGTIINEFNAGIGTNGFYKF